MLTNSLRMKHLSPSRIYKNIMDSVNKRGPAFRQVFDYCYSYKQFWHERGKATPICDKIVFNKIRALLGGKIRYSVTRKECSKFSNEKF